MKKDMGGAANVLALAHMIMDAKLKLRLRVLIPAVENAISGDAFRPLDIYRSRKGITVEIGNTDAEGRLVLADALALADEEAPELIVDMATLTGAARVALGPELPPFYHRRRRARRRSCASCRGRARSRCGACRCGGRTSRCSIPRPPTSTMSAAGGRGLDHGCAVSSASSTARRPGRISTSMAGRRAPSPRVRTAANARPRARFMRCSRSATDNCIRWSASGELRSTRHAGKARPCGQASRRQGRRDALCRRRNPRGDRRADAGAAAPAPDAPLDDRGADGRTRHGLRVRRRRLGLGPARRRRLCRMAAGECVARAARGTDPPGDGAAHARVSRSLDQAAADRMPPLGSAARGVARAGALRGSPIGFLPAAHLAPLAMPRPISSPSPNVSSARPIFGAARPTTVSTARRWCRFRSTPAASPARATATCRSRRWAFRSKSSRCGAVIWFAGKVMSRSFATRTRCVHANAFHMAVAIEPIAEAIARIRATGNEVTSVRRL